jgi:hypothetical protein
MTAVRSAGCCRIRWSEEPEVRDELCGGVDDLGRGGERFRCLCRGCLLGRVERVIQLVAPRCSSGSAVPFSRLLPDHPDDRGRPDLLDERVRRREPSTEREEMLEWAGGEYDPSRFDLATASAAVAGI